MGRNARKPKTPEGDTASGASQRKADAMAVGGRKERGECVLPRDTVAGTLASERMGEREGRVEGGDFWCIGVLIPTLNYPLSWAQLGPLVKTPPLFVLRSR